jgi:phosphatidylglycerophosphatase A
VTSAFGLGFLPIAPGTWGSALVPAVLYPLYLLKVPMQGPLVASILIGLALGLAWLGIWAGDRVSELVGEDDPSEVVVDEVVGQLLTYALLPVAGVAWSGWSFEIALVVGFLLFRALDIVKPGPIHDLQEYHGGLGIMADDFAAGVVGAGVMLAGVQVL